MKPFKATYTPVRWSYDKMNYEPDGTNPRTVLILEFIDADYIEAVFIDNDNTLKSAPLYTFSNCQSTEWR